MTHLLQLITITAVTMLVLSGCGQDNSNGTAQQQSNFQVEDDEEGIISLDEHELSEFGIRLELAAPGVLSNQVSLSGEIVLNPDRVAHVVSRAGGIGLEVLRTIGDLVEVGETLAVLESPELAESKADYLAKAAHAAQAATDFARAEIIHTNTIRLLDIIAENPNVDTLRKEISGLDIGSNRGDLIMAYAELQAAEAIYDQEKTLIERNISSQTEYLTAESELKKALAAFQTVRDDLSFANQRELEAARRSKLVAEVSLQAAERLLHALGLDEDEVKAIENENDMELTRYEIQAPIAGRIIERHLVRGESLDAGEQVFVIADLSSVWAQLTLYQRDLAVVSKGHTARIFGTHNFDGTEAIIEYISPILDEHTRTTTARVVLNNNDGNWRPGLFITAQVETDQYDVAIIVPRSAIQIINDESVIFVEHIDDHQGEGEELIEFEPVPVRLGRTNSEHAEILDGLHQGDRYVATGGFVLKAEMNKASFEHAGHGH